MYINYDRLLRIRGKGNINDLVFLTENGTNKLPLDDISHGGPGSAILTIIIKSKHVTYNFSIIPYPDCVMQSRLMENRVEKIFEFNSGICFTAGSSILSILRRYRKFF